MKIFLYPDIKEWDSLSKRPVFDKSGLEKTVRNILETVRNEGDKALIKYSEQFDGTSPGNLKVSECEITQAAFNIPDELKKAINIAKKNIAAFHASQLVIEQEIQTFPGVKCWRRDSAIEKVGLYIPGGSAPLFSTVLMLGIPAKLAGCKGIILCTPPDKDGNINPLILYTASIIGLTEIYKAGGAQAIAAMAYGTESIPKVYKIFGPGNQYVTKAKELIQMEGVSIDMPAGPSEVLVIGDETADPRFIAADLLSQAEHGPDSQVIMLTNDKDLIYNVKTEVEKQVEEIPRKSTAMKALENSSIILLNSIEDCIAFSNVYSPEHLIINTSNPQSYVNKITNAGSVFLGKYSCESAGDYATGTNHTLPTNGYARNFSGVSVESFMKKISFQEVNEEGIKSLGPVIEQMAAAESLFAHKNAVSIRLKSLEDEN